MTGKTQSVRLYRAGSPDEGEAFWTPNEAYARKVNPDAAIHEGTLVPGFVQKSFDCARLNVFVQDEIKKKEADVLVFHSPDRLDQEYVLLSPQALTIVK